MRTIGQMAKHAVKDTGPVMLSGRACGVTPLWEGIPLISRGPTSRLHFALPSRIPPKACRGGERVRARFRQHLPCPCRSPSTTSLASSAVWPNLEARSWQAEADAVISAPCGRLRPFAAVAEGRVQLTTGLCDTFTPGQLLNLDYMRKFTSKLTARSRGDWGTWPPPSRLDFGRFCCTCSLLPDIVIMDCLSTYPHNHHLVTIHCR